MSRTMRSRIITTFALVLAPVVFFAATHLRIDSSSVWSGIALVIAAAAGSVLLFAPGIAVVVLVDRAVPIGGAAARTTLCLAAAGTLFWAVWWAWVYRPPLGRATAVALWLAIVLVLGISRPARGPLLRPTVAALSLAPLLAVAFVAALSLHGGLAVAPEVAQGSTYSTADNFFPREWMDRVDREDDLRELALGWPLVERPPQQAAWTLPAYSIASNEAFAYEVLSATLQAVAATAVVTLLAVLGLRSWRLVAAASLICLAGFLMFNVVFVWPKLLSAALLVLVVATLLERDVSAPAWAGIGLALGLSVVAHPSGLLAAPAIGIVAVSARTWPRDRIALLVAVGAGALVVAPWVAYQTFYDPGDSLLLKWHLAGFNDPNDPRSFPQVLSDQYQALGVSGWLRNRWENVRYLFGPEIVDPSWPHDWEHVRGRVISAGKMTPLWSGGLLLLTAPALVLRRRYARETGIVTIGAVVGLLIWIVVEWGPPASPASTHNGPYGIFLLFAIGLAAACGQVLPGRALAVLCAIQAGLLVWVAASLGARNGCFRSQMCVPQTYPAGTVRSEQWLLPLAVVAVGALLGAASIAKRYVDAIAEASEAPARLPA